ncbi:hypothetical protein KC19_3G256300 [Ceratodon purpureus]|uniref:Uncharacterized protein n=1 Tax=Ceratodon purpureus TaxID=3225 RepID=A0A8T0IPZ6_CERPU|nr:hypothetical protein KC19_3G256300 [Ceratodon purpureus]
MSMHLQFCYQRLIVMLYSLLVLATHGGSYDGWELREADQLRGGWTCREPYC